MMIPELKEVLRTAGLNLNGIYFGAGLPTLSDVWAIGESRGLWEVYYFERGERKSEHTFANEDAACSFFLNMLLENRKFQQTSNQGTTR
jgi:hypothetical protein